MRSQPLTSLRVNKEGNGVDKGFAARGFGGKIVYAIRLAFQAIGIGRDPTRAARQAAGLDEFRAMIRDRYPATLAAAASDKLEEIGHQGAQYRFGIKWIGLGLTTLAECSRRCSTRRIAKRNCLRQSLRPEKSAGRCRLSEGYGWQTSRRLRVGLWRNITRANQSPRNE